MFVNKDSLSHLCSLKRLAYDSDLFANSYGARQITHTVNTPHKTELPLSFIRKREWLLKSLKESDPSLDYKLFTTNEEKCPKVRLAREGITVRTTRKLNNSLQDANNKSHSRLKIHTSSKFNNRSSQLKLHLPATPMLLINNVAITDREADDSHRRSLLKTVRKLDSFQFPKTSRPPR